VAAYDGGAERRLSAAYARRRAQQRQQRVEEALAMVGLNGFADRKPSGLSGGQQQRVRWPAPSSPNRACCCLMNRSPTSTANCANRCASK
jgi:ABC-type oligopeptide transport system ATPase subunit